MTDVLPESSERAAEGPSVVEAKALSKRFGNRDALRDVSIRVPPGQTHAILGPNGAGKTTLLRLLSGLLEPDAGTLTVAGATPAALGSRVIAQAVGLVPASDRSFYLRITGLENLVFFARLNGMPRRAAVRRALECLESVGLSDAAGLRVGSYSQGMHRRLAVARAMLMRPKVLLLDEATHDLDPEGARRVMDLVSDGAQHGAAVLWATQRLDEIRGFADSVTLLHQGRVRFQGSVLSLMALAPPQRYVLEVRCDTATGTGLLEATRAALSGTAGVEPAGEGNHVVLSMRDGMTLGEAVAALVGRGIQVLDCREERSGIETAFLALTETESG